MHVLQPGGPVERIDRITTFLAAELRETDLLEADPVLSVKSGAVSPTLRTLSSLNP